MHEHNSQADPQGSRILNALEKEGAGWHRVAMGDIAISESALVALRTAGKKILSRHVPADNLRTLTMGDAVALMSRHMFWNENSGKLMVCAHLGGTNYCLPIPPEHWTIRQDGRLH